MDGLPNAPEQSTNSGVGRQGGKTRALTGLDLAVDHRPLESLIPYARNARTHSDAQVAQIAASIKEFGWTNPILVDGENGVIAGHGRLLAARKLGLATVPVIELAGLSAAERRAYVLADNKPAINAGWDDAMLALEVADLNAMGVDLSLAGFHAIEIEKLLAAGADAPSFPDEAPALPDEPVTRPGDLWLMGAHRCCAGTRRSPRTSAWRSTAGSPTWSSPTRPTTSPTRSRPRRSCASTTMPSGRSSAPSWKPPAERCSR